jgi:sarcosine oxidase
MRIAVVGAGVVGLAVTHELHRRGQDVLCFEAAVPMAQRSTGDTRIFRLAHATVELVEWAQRARQGWAEWSRRAGRQLVGDEGAVVSGDVSAIADALAGAGVRFDVTDRAPALPATDPAGPFVIDPHGGVIRAAAAGAFLLDVAGSRVVPEPVTSITVTGGGAELSTASGSERFDSVLVAAGAGTADLAGPAGVRVPSALVHHARFTFPLRDPSSVFPCWLDRSGDWRRGFTSYGQLVAPGRWAVGGHLPDDDVRWELGRDEVTRRSREVVTAYVAEYVDGVRPEVLDTVYCDVTPGLGDGVSAERVGPVLFVWGDNLFKLAPALGTTLTRAATELSVPDELLAIRHA